MKTQLGDTWKAYVLVYQTAAKPPTSTQVP